MYKKLTIEQNPMNTILAVKAKVYFIKTGNVMILVIILGSQLICG
jgi:hypothetical protein